MSPPRRTTDQSLPWRLNVSLLVAATGSALALLWSASHARSWLGLVASAVAFSFVNNTVFALLHESVHGLFHPNPRLNDWFGRWLAAFFPTGLTFQRTCHLGHHRRNRTPVELFDYFTDDDNKLLKFAQWYGILTGIYWLVPPVGCVLFLVVPRALLARAFDTRGSVVAEHVGARAMLAGFEGVPSGRVRLEIVLSLALQVLFFRTLGLTFAGTLACYIAFGLNWSALQYADHAWSKLDVRDGAWNLRVTPIVRWLFLNYHHHLAHHQHPDVSWIHLGRFVEPGVRPSFARIYLSMWRGPRRLETNATVPSAAEVTR